MVIYLGRPNFYLNTHQVIYALQLALMVTSYIAVYLVGYYLAIV